MADCEKLEKCVFFADKMENMPAMAEIMKQRYCLGSNESCARYKVAAVLGGERVPADLFPGDVAYAERVLAS